MTESARKDCDSRSDTLEISDRLQSSALTDGGLSAPAPKRSIALLRKTLSMLCHFIWHRQMRPGEHLWSIPVDKERDFDCILSDAIDELERLRAEAPATAEKELAAIKKLAMCLRLEHLIGGDDLAKRSETIAALKTFEVVAALQIENKRLRAEALAPPTEGKDEKAATEEAVTGGTAAPDTSASARVASADSATDRRGEPLNAHHGEGSGDHCQVDGAAIVKHRAAVLDPSPMMEQIADRLDVLAGRSTDKPS